ncbi:hypothetical protein D3C84_1152290 [compost metagenome]
MFAIFGQDDFDALLPFFLVVILGSIALHFGRRRRGLFALSVGVGGLFVLLRLLGVTTVLQGIQSGLKLLQ